MIAAMSGTDPLSLVAAALAELKAAQSAQGRAITRLEMALAEGVRQGVQTLPNAPLPPCEHRREHRMGRPPKIGADPELQTFIAARLDSMTFQQIADDVAANFPSARRVGRDSIHRWYHKTARRTASRGGDNVGSF